MNNDFDKTNDLLEENVMSYAGKLKYRIDTDQPKNASWVSVDADISSGYACEQVNILDYEDETDMAEQLIRFVKQVFTPELLQLVRDGTVENLSFRIGPRTIGSTQMNEEYGVEKLVMATPEK
ncbi:MAG TPA: hypothetical protein VF575_03585 [Candidatus Saccharimonadales bacterium]